MERPVSLHAEVTCLGAMMVEQEAWFEGTEHLTTLDFALDSHRRIYASMLRVSENGKEVNLETVMDDLFGKGELDTVGGLPYLASLSEGLPRKLSIESYVRIIRDKSIRRQAMTICDRYLLELAKQDEEALVVIPRMQLELMDLEGDAIHQKAETIGQIMPRVLEHLDELRMSKNRDDALGYTYGIDALNQFTKGAFPNEYTIISADTGGAKTAWATQITIDNAMKNVKSLWFSQEMTKEALAQRMISCLSTIVRAKDIRDPRWMGNEEYIDVKKTAAILSRFGIDIDDTRQLPLDQLLARAKAAYHRRDVKLIVVDYIQLVQNPTNHKNRNETERIQATTLALRDLAAESKKHGIHVIGLSQYARPADGGRGKPDNGRLKGSSSLEQSAQNVFHILREKNEDGSWATDAEIRIGKARDGKFGTIKCVFDEDHLRFIAARGPHNQ